MQKTEAIESAITDKNLANSGESTEREARKFITDVFDYCIFPAALVTAAAFMEWFGYFGGSPSYRRLFSIIGLALIGSTIYKVLRVRSIVKAHQQGADGEKAVGSFLEKLIAIERKRSRRRRK